MNTILLVIVLLILLRLWWENGKLSDGFIDGSETLDEILEELEKIKAALTPVGAAGVRFYALVDGKKVEVKNMQKKVSDEINLSVSITDKFGNPAKVDGAPAWSVNDASLGSLDVAADGMSAKFNPAGKIGSCKFQLQADADLGEGVKPILGESEDLELLAGDAEKVSIVIS